MARQTPPMGISGSFLLREPFVADPQKSYTVVAVRQFYELISRGQDPIELIYRPVGLGDTAYQADKAAGTLVICLRDRYGSLLYVPDTYVQQYPNMGSVSYSRLVLAVSLGMWPDSRNLDDITQVVTESVASKIGVTPVVHVTRAPTGDHISEEQHVQLMAARRAAVTHQETDTATIIRLTDEIAKLQRIIDEQVGIINELVRVQTQEVTP